jgi:hypothetical protein
LVSVVPAAGAPSSRRASSLPASIAIHRIVAQFVVVVEVLIAERNPEHRWPTNVTTSCSIGSARRSS